MNYVSYLYLCNEMGVTQKKSAAAIIGDARGKFDSKISKQIRIDEHNYRVVCNICGAQLNSITKYTLTKHLSREKHRNAVKHKLIQTSIDASEEDNAFDSRAEFQRELVTMMLAANIPLKKLRHPMVRKVLNKYSKYELPTEPEKKRCR